ncbi:hypothetical protein GGH92_010537, partial [Coemansia sp. RSA 2673]
QNADTIMAYMMKIDRNTHTVVEDEYYAETTLGELAEELPIGSPRYLLLSYSYKHGDGRVSYPLVLVYYCPVSARPDDLMLYACKLNIFVKLAKLDKTFTLTDSESLTQEWLDQNVTKHAS